MPKRIKTKTEKPLHPVTQYAQDVVDGKIVAGRLVLLQCQRHLRDLETCVVRGLYFDEDAADHAIDFYQFLKHSKGKWARQSFVLEPWQQFIVGSIFGWKRASDGTRRFRDAYVEIARKNGKSTLAAGIGLYLFFADGEPGAEVYTAATKRDQAKIIWDEAKRMVLASPALRKRIKVLTANLNIEKTASKFEPLGADGDTMDGLNPHGVIIDELHAHKTREVVDVLETALGAREQPLQFKITTAGHNRNSVCWEQREYAVKVLEGLIEDDSVFAYIACLDKDDDWRDPTNYIKANPNLGVSVKLEDLEQLVKQAIETPGKQNSFRRLRLNEWTSQEERWLDMDKWDACGKDFTLEEMRGRKCFLGLDLSTKIDLTALVAVFPPDEEDKEWRLICWFFMPSENIDHREKEDSVPYRRWVDEGYITATPGNIVDYEFIRVLVRDTLAKDFDIEELGYDSWNAAHIATQLTSDGLEMIEMRQGMKTMSGPAKDFEALVVAGLLNHGNNPVLRWMASNVSIRRDANDNYMPQKPDGKAKFRIDGIVASIMALGRAMVKENDPENPYEKGGIMFM